MFNIRITLATISVLFFSITTTTAQPQVDWWRSYVVDLSSLHNYPNDIYHSASEDFAICGSVDTPTGFWFLHTASNGDLMANSRIRHPQAGDGLQTARTIIETDDANYVLGGYAPVAGASGYAGAKSTAEGELIWFELFGQNFIRSDCQAVIELKNGNLLFAGWGRRDGGDEDGLLVLTDQDGQEIWSRAYGINDYLERFYALREVADDGIVVAGRISNRATNNHDFWLIKTDFDGNVVWEQNFEGEADEYLTGMTSCQGGFALAGVYRLGDENRWRLKHTDNNGNLQWDNNFDVMGIGQLSTLFCQGVVRMPDDGFVVYGSSGTDRDPVRGVCIRTNAGGELVWARSDLINEESLFYTGAVVEAEGSIVLCGYYSDGDEDGRADDYNGVVVKLLAEHNAPRIIRWSPFAFNQKVLMDDSLVFSAFAEDRDDDTLMYSWKRGQTPIADDTSVVVYFENIGSDTVSVEASDGGLTDSRIWRISVADLFISSHSPDSLSLSLRQGASQTFSLDTVRAVEGDPVQYQWTLIDLNNFEREDVGSETHATVEFLRSGNYQIEGLAYRGESRDNVIWTIAVRSAILDFWPRDLNLSVLPDSLVNFGVLPFNPESDSLSYAWFLDGDLIGQDSAVGWWFAPLDSQAGRSTYAVNAVVMDGAEGDTVRWEVTVREPDEVGKWAGGQVGDTLG